MKCKICGRLLNQEDPTTKDLGGDCLKCMALIVGDPDAIKALNALTSSFTPEIWTEEQVHALNKWQEEGKYHPFTCPGDKPGCENRRELIATKHGWVCQCGEYTQQWAHDFMFGDMK